MVHFMEPIVGSAVRDLQNGLKVYWPATGKNEMAEAHPLGALGRAFGRKAFFVFAQVRCVSNPSRGHVDLFAIDTAASLGIAIEGKRLYDERGAASVLSDWRRLAKAQLANNENHGPNLRQRYRMIVTTTRHAHPKRWRTSAHQAAKRRNG